MIKKFICLMLLFFCINCSNSNVDSNVNNDKNISTQQKPFINLLKSVLINKNLNWQKVNL